MTILMKQGLFQPQALVSIRDIPGLNYLAHVPGQGLRIGSMFSQHGLEISAELKRHFPMLASAASKVGNIRVRCQSTVGGTLCEADHQSDVPPTLTALDATVAVAGVGGAREVPIGQFYLGHYETVLQPGELVTEVQVPDLPTGARGVYLKHVTGPVTDRPCLGVAAVIRTDKSGRVDHARVVAGGVAGMPWRIESAEALLMGERPGDSLFDKIAETAYTEADPMSDLRGSAWYKREMVKVFVRRALEQATAEQEVAP